MSLKSFAPSLIAIGALALSAPAYAAAYAATVPGLFNTGVDAAGVALAGGAGVSDPHYRIVSSTIPGVAGQQAVTFRASAYLSDDADSRWISVNASGADGFSTTVYRTTFDLTGFDPAGTTITGLFGSDNPGSLSLNGGAALFNAHGFQSLFSFSLSSGFVAGLNTLDIMVENLGGPTAFRLDSLTVTARELPVVDPIPEPATWGMMIGGFGLVGGAMRRRRPTTLLA